jgi:hypothetical protein
VASACGVALEHGLHVRRLLGGKLLVQVQHVLDQADHPVMPRDVGRRVEVDGADGEETTGPLMRGLSCTLSKNWIGSAKAGPKLVPLHSRVTAAGKPFPSEASQFKLPYGIPASARMPPSAVPHHGRRLRMWRAERGGVSERRTSRRPRTAIARATPIPPNVTM